MRLLSLALLSLALLSCDRLRTTSAEEQPAPTTGPTPGKVETRVRLETLDGRTLDGELRTLDERQALSGSGLPDALRLDDLRRMEFARPAPDRDDRVVVDLTHGGRLLAHHVRIREERVEVRMSAETTWLLPLDAVRSVRFDRTTATSRSFEQSADRPAAEVDRFFVVGPEGGAPEGFEGLIERLTDDEAVLERDGKLRTLPLKRLYGIVLAQAESADRDAPAGRLELIDGSIVPYRRLVLDGERFELTGPGGWSVAGTRSQLGALRHRSPRLTPLAALEPVRADERNLAAPKRNWRRNSSVTGRRLTLGDRSFDEGLGVQASSRLEFALDDRFELFLATVGIDAETRGEGDCQMSVLADDRRLWSGRVRGGDPPVDLRLDVAGARRLVLLVEPGEDLDLSDHADWADARLVARPAP